jgi:ribosomal subunit interface protein
MQLTPQITFRDVKHSPEVEAHIYSNIDKIERLSCHLISCRIVISSDGHHQQDDTHYQTLIKVLVPGKELISKRSKEGNLYKSIDNAFDHIRRQLDDYDKKLHNHHADDLS